MHALTRATRLHLPRSCSLRQHRARPCASAKHRHAATQAAAMSKQPESSRCLSLLEAAKTRVKAQLILDKDSTTAATAICVHPVTASSLESFLQELNQPAAAAWASINKFKAKSGEVLLVPNEHGAVSAAVLGVGEASADLWAYAALPGKLPPGSYKLALPEAAGRAAADKALLGWMLGMRLHGIAAASVWHCCSAVSGAGSAASVLGMSWLSISSVSGTHS